MEETPPPKDPDPFAPLVGIALLIGALFYLGGIIYAGVESYDSTDEPDLNAFVQYAVVTIGAALGTHFGAVLGISRVKGGGGRGIAGVSASRFGRAASASATTSALHVAAAYFYFGALCVAAIAWLFDGFSGDSAELLRTLGFDLIGVIVGITAVVLSIPRD